MNIIRRNAYCSVPQTLNIFYFILLLGAKIVVKIINKWTLSDSRNHTLSSRKTISICLFLWNICILSSLKYKQEKSLVLVEKLLVICNIKNLAFYCEFLLNISLVCSYAIVAREIP